MKKHTAMVCIIGTGFGGLGMAIRLKQEGIDDFILLEKAHEVGGCWRDNHYPGAACDVPSHLYSFSFEPKTDWSRKFAPQPEIYDYLRHCADKYGLRSHIRFGTEVASAAFDAERGVWTVRSTDDRVFEARMLVSACGQLNRPAYPKVEGLDDFAGPRFHSARWDHDVDLRGKRVAVIGSGASAIQFVPQIAKQVGHLDLYQRTAPYVMPKPDRRYSVIEKQLYSHLPAVQRMDRIAQYWTHEVRALAFTRFSGLLKPYRWRFHKYLQRNIHDPALRQRLEPDYPIGCKRVLISNDWFEALARPNVEVVTEAIERVTPRGIRTRDGREHAADVLIYGTGFQATDFLAPMQIRGLGGVELNEAWRGGAEAYLGMAVSGFPNLFMLYGPNTNLGHSSIVYMLESQIGYVMQALEKLRAGMRWLDVKPQVQQRFNRALQERIKHTVWDQGCSSWYKTADGKNTNNWPGFTFEYRRSTRTLDPDAYTLEPTTSAAAA
ncbi:NAD(P)/FAD-dependent oxidoreductase [Sinimarinibacterium sp. CAU 1509]|uniref:flavin-containing monooxygenase n=1 Tax=Sinimarinibacterium sp. CAU 1509 TaxID=2562283 RepID=UPI0010AC5E2E|nr:NAD(P)/FAD-dependent oxidoreductase [Sinimarinibacterium sp. CAU 1509]TJY64954.1 NAD(P)/FAD-dependent oxidoreductase [Sinimarinibacterium sp. CAU 1509]